MQTSGGEAKHPWILTGRGCHPAVIQSRIWVSGRTGTSKPFLIPRRGIRTMPGIFECVGARAAKLAYPPILAARFSSSLSVLENAMGKAELESSLSTLEIWLIVFGVLVAVGVVGGSVAGFMHWRRSGQLSVLQAAENFSQQKDIERLSAEAETARSEIGEANAQAAEANRIAEEERLARVKLEAQLAGRHLTDDQKSQLTAALTKLQGQIPTLIFARLGDREAHEYATEVLNCVTNAGISTSISDIGTQSPPRYGLIVTPDLKPAFETSGIPVNDMISNVLLPPTIFVALKPPAF